VKKFKHQLPYLPDIINYLGCPALKTAGGLYIPCGGKQNEEEQFCASCAKHSAKYGTLSDRGPVGSYTDPSDKHEISYGTWLAKNEVSIEEVNKEITDQGFTFQIPESYLTVNSKRATAPKRRPGRPGAVKKTKINEDGTESPMGTSLDGVDVKVVIDSDGTITSEDEEEKPKKKSSKAKAEEPKKKKAEEPDEEEKPKKKSSKAKEPKSPEEKALKEKEKAEAAEKKKAEKELAKGVSEAKKKAKEEEKRAKESPKNKKGEKSKKKQEEAEEETEEVVIDGTEYMMVGNKLFDDSGTLVGSIQNGKAEFIHA
jgi:hypothetical protein